MENRSNTKTTEQTFAFGRHAWAAALCLALVATCADAEPNPGQAKPTRDDASAKPSTVTPEPSQAKPEAAKSGPEKPEPVKPGAAKPKAKKAAPAVKGGCGADKKGAAKTKIGQDSNARWACSRPTVTLEPVWQGKSLTFEFQIRNEGTADLKIKARGG